MLSENIFRYRRSLGLSQEQLAERIGVSRQTVSKWEGGQSTPDVERLVVLADCFGITVDTLIRGEAQMPVKSDAEGSRKNRIDPITILGVVICILGLLCMMLLCMLQILYPASLDVLNQSSMSVVTFNGTGIVFGFCMISVIVGLVIIFLRK